MYLKDERTANGKSPHIPIKGFFSTETSELDGSIRGKQAQVAKLQEEILVLSIKKDKVSEDMEKVQLYKSAIIINLPRNYQHWGNKWILSSSISPCRERSLE